MIRHLYAFFALAAMVLLLAGQVHAQDKTFTLTVTNQDLQVLSAALDELPRKVSEPLVEKFQKELVAQMTPPPAVASTGATGPIQAGNEPKAEDKK